MRLLLIYSLSVFFDNLIVALFFLIMVHLMTVSLSTIARLIGGSSSAGNSVSTTKYLHDMAHTINEVSMYEEKSYYANNV